MFWRVYPIYVVPKSRKRRIEEIRNKKELYDFVDSASPEKIKKLHEEIEHWEKLKKKENSRNVS